MVLDMDKYADMINDLNINIIYSGPMWGDGVRGISKMVKAHLAAGDLPSNMAKSIFSVFVEQVTNMLMYSAKKESFPGGGKGPIAVSTGMMVLGHTDSTYFIQTRNAIKKESVQMLESRIEVVNSLDKKALRKYHRDMLNTKNLNPESRGAGLGFIEIARRATAPIEYSFTPIDDKLSYFTLYVEIGQERKG